METITLTYNPASVVATSLLETIRKSGAFKVKTEATHYNPELVDMVEDARKNRKKAVSIKTADLWK